MKILAVDGVPVLQEVPEPASTSKKIKILQTANEDFEWYPTTPEIMESMRNDIWAYLRSHRNDYYPSQYKEKVKINTDYSCGLRKNKKSETIQIDSFLDIGAGDGRVLDFLPAHKKYGIEIAKGQADDLIRRGVFLIGRDFWITDLMNDNYGLVFSNPPFSHFEDWVVKILYECNFEILYLVMPVRWKNSKNIARELDRYEAAVIGEFDFSKADREARGRVNLVRVNAPWIETEKSKKTRHQKTLEDSFERWVHDYIADFSNITDFNHEYSRFEGDEKNALKLKLAPIDQLVEDYENEKETLRQAFSVIGKLPKNVVEMLGQDRGSMMEIIRKSISGLKVKYWRAAFDKLDPVQERMTRKTRNNIFRNIKEFNTLDFNAENIYSVIIWLINNANIGILDQIGEVFDELATKENIQNYKSNRHWIKSDWKHTQRDWRYESLPDRWKLGTLDYRIVACTYQRDNATVVDDFIVICRNLGFPIIPHCRPNYELHSTEQKFLTEDDELAFTMRFYTGNRNAHLKINKKLLMKFNVEVAKIRKWITGPEGVEEEFDVSKAEAAKLWNSGLALLGANDMKMLEFKGAI
jgi:hypothetical protein